MWAYKKHTWVHKKAQVGALKATKTLTNNNKLDQIHLYKIPLCIHSATNSPELLLLAISLYNHSHFLATNLDFASFFTMAFWGLHPFLQIAIKQLIIRSENNCM